MTFYSYVVYHLHQSYISFSDFSFKSFVHFNFLRPKNRLLVAPHFLVLSLIFGLICYKLSYMKFVQDNHLIWTCKKSWEQECLTSAAMELHICSFLVFLDELCVFLWFLFLGISQTCISYAQTYLVAITCITAKLLWWSA